LRRYILEIAANASAAAAAANSATYPPIYDAGRYPKLTFFQPHITQHRYVYHPI
jgi:hypothetical protein